MSRPCVSFVLCRFVLCRFVTLFDFERVVEVNAEIKRILMYFHIFCHLAIQYPNNMLF